MYWELTNLYINIVGLNKKSKDQQKSEYTDEIKVLKPTTIEEHVPKTDIQSVYNVTD